jgi:hypothetical protein
MVRQLTTRLSAWNKVQKKMKEIGKMEENKCEENNNNTHIT